MHIYIKRKEVVFYLKHHIINLYVKLILTKRLDGCFVITTVRLTSSEISQMCFSFRLLG